jgi:hypothetical protein
MNITLSVVHQIFLNKEERYKLVKKHLVETIGVSIPIWSSNTFTTEPAEEIFCKYILMNDDNPTNIERFAEGYLINVPGKMKLPRYPSDEKWRAMSRQDQEDWYDKHDVPITIKHLLDIKDGGSEYLRFQLHNIMQYKEHLINVFHYIEIKDMELLKDSLT